MKPQFDLRNSRSLSQTSLSGLPPSPSKIPDGPVPVIVRFSRRRGSAAALACLGIALSGALVDAQQPSPIPNWPSGQQGAAAGQYAPNSQYVQEPLQQQNGQQEYQQEPQYQQPAYGQQGYPQQGYPQQGYPQQQQSYNDPTQGFAAPYQPAQALSPDHLEQMVAPIALYPDNLVSMVLAASTYPAQVAAADQWLHMQGGAPPEQIAAGANAQSSWDPSVKALTAFPQVLDQMGQNLQWTTDLGNAYYNQPQDVMQTIQVMRSRAQEAGNLQSTSQQEVIQDQGNIEIAPPTPQVVYVPQYNPWAVYGQPVNPYPGFNILGAIGSFVGNAFLQFGPGIAMNAFAVTPFGWLGWGLDWLAHAIFFGNNVWCTHSGSVHDWGFAHGGARYWGAHGELAGSRNYGSFGGSGGWHNTFRSGLDRGNFPHAIRSAPGTFNGGNRAYGRNQGNLGNRNGGYDGAGNGYTHSRENGYTSSGNSIGTYGQRGGNGYGRAYGQNGSVDGRSNGYSQPNSAYAYANRGPQATGRPQQPYGGTQRYAQGRAGAYGDGQQAYPGSSGLYNHPLQNYGMRPGFGGGSYAQSYRSPGYGAATPNRSYGYGGSYGGYSSPSKSYSGSNAYGGSYIARAPSGGGFHPFGSNHQSSGVNYGGSYKAPRASSFGGGNYKAPKAPHFSSGGGGHFGGGGHSGGGGHFNGSHGGGKHH